MDTLDQLVAKIAASQGGDITLAQAIEAGMSEHQVRGRVERGVWIRMHPGVYHVGACVTVQARRWAAALAGPTGTLAAGVAAEDELGIGRWPSDVIQIVTPTRMRALDGVRSACSRTLIPEDAAAPRPGRVPVTSVERTLVDLAGERTVRQLGRSLREAAFRGMLDEDRLRWTMGRNRTQRGAGRLREALTRFVGGDGGTDSSYEDRFCRMLDAAGIEYDTNRVFRFGRSVVRPDVYVPQLDLLVEVDPTWHGIEQVTREDQLRESLILLAGHQYLSVPGDELRAGAERVIALWQERRIDW